MVFVYAIIGLASLILGAGIIATAPDTPMLLVGIGVLVCGAVVLLRLFGRGPGGHRR